MQRRRSYDEAHEVRGVVWSRDWSGQRRSLSVYRKPRAQAEGGSLILFVGAGPHAAMSCPTPLWPSRILLEKSFPVDGPTQAGIFLLSWPPAASWAGSEDSWFDRRQLLDRSASTGGKLDPIGGNDVEMVCRHLQPGIDGNLTAVGHGVDQLKLRDSGAQGVEKRVFIFCFLRNGSGLNGHAASPNCLAHPGVGSFRQIEFKSRLGQRRRRGVAQAKKFNDLKFVSLGLVDLGLVQQLEPGYFGSGVVNRNLHTLGAWPCSFVIVHAVMPDSNEVERVWVADLELEFAAGVGLGARLFLHSLSQFEQNHIIPGSRLVRSSVRDNAGEGLALGCCDDQTCEENNQGKALQWDVLLQA